MGGDDKVLIRDLWDVELYLGDSCNYDNQSIKEAFTAENRKYST